jgi:hypothetical protein
MVFSGPGAVQDGVTTGVSMEFGVLDGGGFCLSNIVFQ